MQMTAREIASSFNRVANKKDQVVILAELNACDKETICEVLRQNGVEESKIPDFGRKTIVVENQDKKGGAKTMARKAAEQAEKTETQATAPVEAPATSETDPRVLAPAKTNGDTAEHGTSGKKVVPKAVIEVVKAEMQRLCEVINEAEAKRAELAAFIIEAE